MIDYAGFQKRAHAYLEHAAEAACGWYDERGNWKAGSMPAATRERFWLCFALYTAGKATLADAVIRQGSTDKFRNIHFNIFDTNIAVALLAHHRKAMAPDVVAKLERLTRDGFSFKPGNRQPDYQFHGYNDNMPAKGTMGLILGGEMLRCPEAVEYGIWSLRQLRAMLVRCGTISEFNSPTYSALTIHAMGEIAALARSPEARKLALGIEHRLWIDLAARFHPGLGMTAGPYSRAYTIDTIAHASIMASLLWFVLGDAARPSPMQLFDPDPGLVVHHMGDYPFNIVQMCWFAGGRYHVPALARRMFQKKAYPFRAFASAEHGDGGPDFPARPCHLRTFLDKDYTVATSSTSFCGGEQTMSYFASYARKPAVKSFRDVGTVFTKLVIDDDVPGAIERPKLPAGPGGQKPRPCSNSGENDCLTSRANTITLQSDSTALVLTHPHLSLGGAPDTGKGARPLKRLNEMVIFPSHFAGADEILVGGKRRRSWSGTARHGDWIACRRGQFLIAVRPLCYSRTLGPVALTLEKINHYEIIRATFYKGPKRAFTRAELRHVFGGFVAEHASVREFRSLAEFVRHLGKTRFTDYFWTTRRVRYRRPAFRGRPALEMETSCSPGSIDPRIAAVNGLPIPTPRVQIDGVREKDLPFLNEPFTSVPSFFPWKDFRVEWGDWPYAIGDREVDGR